MDRRLRLSTAALAVAAALIPAPAIAQQERADALLEEGRKLGDAGKFEAAREKLREAFKLKQSYDIAGNLGLVEAQLGEDAAAAEHLDYAIRIFPARAKPESKRHVVEVFNASKSRVGCFRFHVNVDGARLILGERELGPSPNPNLFCAKPGAVTLTVDRDGFHSSTLQLEAKASEEQPISITLEANRSDAGGGGASAAGGAGAGGESAGAGGADGSGGGPVEPADEKPMWPAVVLGASAAVGLGVGIAGVVVGTGKHGDAEDLIATCLPAACKAYADDLLSEGNTFVGLGIAGFSVAGAAAIGAVIYLVVPPAGSTAAARITPGPGQAGLSLSGSF
jgi:hypothetical protein